MRNSAYGLMQGRGGRRAQLVARKEEAVEMGGYFICNGIERIIRLLVQQRRHYIMALRRSAFRKRGSNYTDLGTLIRWTLVGCRPFRSCVLHL